MHLHVAPSLIPRVADIVEVARQAEDAGYRAIVIKDHHCNSAPAVNQVKKHLFSESDLRIFGSISLNNSVGGLNSYVVEAAIGLGAKVVWMPTVSAAQHIKFHGGGGSFPGTTVALREKPIVLINEKGRLKPEVEEIIEILAHNPQVVLATGHGTAEEVNAVVERAAEAGVKNIMVDHPTFGLGATLEQIKHWASLGAWIENCGTISDPNNEHGIPVKEIAALIREIGVERTVLSSDYGQMKFGHCIEGMDLYLKNLSEEGLTEDELKRMSGDNPATLLSI
jgi:hypothetical protein